MPERFFDTQLFRERLSHNSTKAHATMPIGIMGNNSLAPLGSCLRCLARRKERAWTQVYVLFPSLTQKYYTLSLICRVKPPLPIITFDIVAFTFTLLWDNLPRNSCIQVINEITTAKWQSDLFIQTELDDTMSSYQLIITIAISHKSKSFIWRGAFTCNSHFNIIITN